MASAEPKVEGHQQAEVDHNLRKLSAVAAAVRSDMGFSVAAELVEDNAAIPPGAKKVHFIRHGEGHHNVAQREWRARDWDGVSEPYTIDNDQDFRYADALLTDKGEGQARALQERAAALQPELLVVSPLRRATQTGLLAFEKHVAAGLPTVAVELAHEMGGRHTCDRRLSKTELVAAYPAVSYELLESEEDPYWADGVTRESWESLARRAAALVGWLRSRDETHIVVAAHSAFLLSVFNAVLVTQSEEARGWFGTGEMRTVMLIFSCASSS